MKPAARGAAATKLLAQAVDKCQATQQRAAHRKLQIITLLRGLTVRS